MLEAEKKLGLLSIISYPHYQKSSDKKDVLNNLKKAAKRFLPSRLATYSDILNQLKKGKGMPNG